MSGGAHDYWYVAVWENSCDINTSREQSFSVTHEVKYERRTSRYRVHQEILMDFHVNKKVYMARIKDCRVISVRLRRYNVAMYKFALKHTTIKRIILLSPSAMSARMKCCNNSCKIKRWRDGKKDVSRSIYKEDMSCQKACKQGRDDAWRKQSPILTSFLYNS